MAKLSVLEAEYASPTVYLSEFGCTVRSVGASE
jgi:hypothetical protein